MRPSSRWTYMTGVAVGIALIAAACSSAAATPSALTGQNGMTLYVLTSDTPDTSTCTASCATNWPPLTVPSGTTATSPVGAMDSFGTITRPDGTTQVTYNHMPLYYYSGDSAAGDTNGEGKLGVWFVAPLSGAVSSAAPSTVPLPQPTTTSNGTSMGQY